MSVAKRGPKPKVDDAHVARLLRQGLSASVIRERLGCSAECLRQAINRVRGAAE